MQIRVLPAFPVFLVVVMAFAGCLGASESGAGGGAPVAGAPEIETGEDAEVLPPSPAPAPVGAEGASVLMYTASGTTLANAALWGLDTAVATGVRALDFPVPANATALVYEVVWDDDVQDLDAELTAPSACVPPEEVADFALAYAGMSPPHKFLDTDGMLGAPDDPSRITLDEATLAAARCEGGAPPDDGSWGDRNYWAGAFRSKDANALLDWVVYASVFFGGPVPEGYTAVPAA